MVFTLPPPPGLSPIIFNAPFFSMRNGEGGLFPFPTRNSPDSKASVRDSGQQPTGGASGGTSCPRFSLRLLRFPPRVSGPHPSFAAPPPAPCPSPHCPQPPPSYPAGPLSPQHSGGSQEDAKQWRRRLRRESRLCQLGARAAAPAVPPRAERLGAGLSPAGARAHKHPHTDIHARALTLTDARTGVREPRLDGGVQER